ncbi:hypothetical protein ACIQGZ_00745 [Streptomyces sp. NPDC092296]|uniref:hypothetical protein n=1 Tax=Streptomyces sp. NPDC092296 TaxID=3366012 RepID=UPI003802D450
MENSEPVSTVRELIDQVAPAPDAPVVLEAPEDTRLAELIAEVGRWAGRPRSLAAGGLTDPSLTERTGLPLAQPFGGELLEMVGWADKSRWIGCGRVPGPEGALPVPAGMVPS